MKRKRSARGQAADNLVSPAAQQLVQTALDRVTPYVQQTADRVGPAAQSAANRVAPLAATAAERINAASVLLSPYAQSAAGQIGPLAQTAAHKVGPLAAAAAERVSPYAQQAAERVAPYAHQAADLVTPYAQQAADLVAPYATKVGPLASAAVHRGSQAAHEAVDVLGPKLDEARDRVGPAVEAARDRVTDELLPRLGEALSAAAATPAVVEATKRGRATLAAARGELELPEPKQKRRWLRRLAILAAVAGVAALVVNRLLGNKDADWQAARPTTPYAPSTPTTPSTPSTPSTATTPSTPAADAPADASASSAVADHVTADEDSADELAHPSAGLVDEEALVAADAVAGDDTAIDAMLPTDAVEPSPQTPLTEEGYAEGSSLDSSPDEAPTVSEGDQPAEVVVVDELDADAVEPSPAVESTPAVEPTETAAVEDLSTSETVDVSSPTAADSSPEGDGTTSTAAEDEDTSGSARRAYPAEGAYVGSEPPEGFFIKGNERSMKYHTPESGGYSDTVAEVWFSSEQAAEEAGFVRAQG